MWVKFGVDNLCIILLRGWKLWYNQCNERNTLLQGVSEMSSIFWIFKYIWTKFSTGSTPKIDLTFASFMKIEVVKPYFTYGRKLIAGCSLYFYYQFGLNSKRFMHGDVEYFVFFESWCREGQTFIRGISKNYIEAYIS